MPMSNEAICSVCCLGYNHAHFLEQNIRAIWEGEYKQIEIIVVDDGSTDSSVRMLNALAKQSPFPMKIIAQENTANIGRNFNNALKEARGKYILFMSLDDVLYPDAISSKIRLMELDNNICFVATSKMMGVNGVGEVCDCVPKLRLASIPTPSVRDLLQLEYSDFGSFYIQGCVFRKDIVDQVGGFDEDMTGDDIVLRTKVFLHMLRHPDMQFKIINSPSCYYRFHPNNIHKNGIRQMKIVTEYLSKYWEKAPNPPILISWMLGIIMSKPLEEYAVVFTYSKHGTMLLLEEQIQQAMKESILLSYLSRLRNS